MNKYYFLLLFSVASLLLSNCNSAKKATATPLAKLTYEGKVATVIMNNCVPCHIQAKGGKMKAYDNYTNIKTDINEIIRRIELNPGEKGFMPFKKTAKLSDSTIQVFKQWRADGVLEK
jgi:uncharacterized membrane protein